MTQQDVGMYTFPSCPPPRPAAEGEMASGVGHFVSQKMFKLKQLFDKLNTRTMNEEDMQRILNDLADRGFNDDQLRREIESKEALNLPTFTIKREKNFGDDRMFYRLFFQWSEAIMGFELKTIHANHRMPVDIDRKFVNGIDSSQLDKEMAGIDWTIYWKGMLEGKEAEEVSVQAAGCIDGIAQLLLHNEAAVNLVGEQLMYKHWPAEILAIFSKDPEKIHGYFEHNFNFSLDSFPDISADLAYLVVSERIDALEMQIADLRLPHIQESAIRNAIFKTLKHLPGKEELKFNFATEKYYATLSIPLKLTKGWYKVDGYELSVVPFPEIELGIINGIDTARLDKKLETVDWRNDNNIVSLASDNHSIFPDDIALLQENLFRLALRPEGKLVADQLMLKYWLCAPVFEDFISPGAMELLNALSAKTYKFPSDITIGNAINLLLGRPVLKDQNRNQDVASSWLRLMPSKKGYQELVTFPGISIKELQNLINLLPVDNSRKSGIERDLINGEVAQTMTKSGRAFYIILTETATGIQLFDRNKKEIPFNFHMEADWMPTQGQYSSLQQQPPDAKEILPNSRSVKKYKGRRP